MPYNHFTLEKTQFKAIIKSQITMITMPMMSACELLATTISKQELPLRHIAVL